MILVRGDGSADRWAILARDKTERERETEKNQPLRQHEARPNPLICRSFSRSAYAIRSTAVEAHWLRCVGRTSCNRASTDLSLKKELKTAEEERNKQTKKERRKERKKKKERRKERKKDRWVDGWMDGKKVKERERDQPLRQHEARPNPLICRSS